MKSAPSLAISRTLRRSPSVAVRLAAEIPGMAAGDGDRLAAGEDAGAVPMAELRTPAARRTRWRARRRGRARVVMPAAKRAGGAQGGGGDQDAVGLAHGGLERDAVAGQVEVDVGVDQPRQHGAAGEAQLDGVGGHRCPPAGGPGTRRRSCRPRSPGRRRRRAAAPVPSIRRSAWITVVRMALTSPSTRRRNTRSRRRNRSARSASCWS